jgi:hypothetical protein
MFGAKGDAKMKANKCPKEEGTTNIDNDIIGILSQNGYYPKMMGATYEFGTNYWYRKKPLIHEKITRNS